jgi:5-oxoprolinase (ATP-hydrolysing)
MWETWIDTGGTFTDCIATDDRGAVGRAKVLSSSAIRGSVETVLSPRRLVIRTAYAVPGDFYRGFRFSLLSCDHDPATVVSFDPDALQIELDGDVPPGEWRGHSFELRSPEEAPILAARLVTGTPAGRPLPSMAVRLATTRGTNALLERRGAPTAFFITEGFGDLLKIGDQQRPDLFALDIRKPEPLYDTVVEVDERIDAAGLELRPVDLESVACRAAELVKRGVTSAAVTLLHSYVNPSHEREVADTLRAEGFSHVTCSFDVAPFIKVLPRAQTTVVNAYLSPVIDDYLRAVAEPLGESRMHVMTSAGGLTGPDSYRARDSLLSGPAGGVVGAARAGRLSGFSRVIAFDMGGTSTDVARYDGDYDYVFEHRVGDASLVAPALAIESVAAGGGSVCGFDGSELSVGPSSAGASPGPACYGAGGPLTLTDANLLLGRLDPGRFDIPIHGGAAAAACETLIDDIENCTGERPARESLLEGFCDIANERMAEAIRRISVRRGYDPADYAMVAFGGAGGQHACAIASLLGVHSVVIPVDVSLLSALGLGHAAVERFAERQVLETLDAVTDRLGRWMDSLARQAASQLRGEGVDENNIEIRRSIANLRFVGQESTLQVEYTDAVSLGQSFEAAYRKIFGHWQKGRTIEVESIRVVASSRRHAPSGTAPASATRPDAPAPQPTGRKRSWFSGRWRDVPVYERPDLAPGNVVEGPALIYERFSVTAVENRWRARVDEKRAMVLSGPDAPATAARKPRRDGGGEATELVRLELFTNRFRSVADEMGEMLRRTAVSTNVKERLDFSCAVLDPDGGLVVNAPHIPVHLGAMGQCVRSVAGLLTMRPGDVVITNHPAFGGSHLPDVTVVTPVFAGDNQLLGYVANRAHHAELGGIRPGSMPPAAGSLAEEGVVIRPVRLFARGKPQWERITDVLTGNQWPTRAPEENLADIRAAVAANRRGAEALTTLARNHGADTVRRYMTGLQKRAENKLRQALTRKPDGVYGAAHQLDDGSPLCVRFEIRGDRVRVDFAGSADVRGNSLNAPPAVTYSALIYVLRLLVDEPLPLNEGLMNAVSVDIPAGILNPPFPDDDSRAPAIVGGNVETSQRPVGAMLEALGLAAGSQGTMNNVIFGTDRYSYYETVCGGAGAGPGFHGADAVHTHMTNTRITDPEIVEKRYPIRLLRFAVRRGSGGPGRYRGGDGVVREYRFLDKMSVSVLGQHRESGPSGLGGGEAGSPARLSLIRPGRKPRTLGSVDGCEARAGDTLVVETPGGGGWGAPRGPVD